MNILKQLLRNVSTGLDRRKVRCAGEGTTDTTATPAHPNPPKGADYFATITAVPESFDPLHPGYVQNPYSLLAALRAQDPMHRSTMSSWVLTRYQDIVKALADPRLGNQPSPYAVVNKRNRHRYICADVANNILPFQDEPLHTLPRKLISKAFLDQLKNFPPDIHSIANALIEAKLASGSMDILHDFATPLSVSVLASLLGIPQQDEARLKTWSGYFFYLFTSIPSQTLRDELDINLTEFRSYFFSLLAERRKNPGNDLISALMQARHEGQALTEVQLIDTCMLLFADGVENVDRLITSAVALLLLHPGQLKLLQDNPALMPKAVDECLRYESPAQFIGRVALQDLEMHGRLIKKGSGVLLLLAAANRDPEQFEAADEFIIQRKPNNYVSFGKGRHACIGGSLVRLEVEAALITLLQRLKGLSLESEVLEWAPRPGHRWLESLPVRFTQEQGSRAV